MLHFRQRTLSLFAQNIFRKRALAIRVPPLESVVYLPRADFVRAPIPPLKIAVQRRRIRPRSDRNQDEGAWPSDLITRKQVRSGSTKTSINSSGADPPLGGIGGVRSRAITRASRLFLSSARGNFHVPTEGRIQNSSTRSRKRAQKSRRDRQGAG